MSATDLNEYREMKIEEAREALGGLELPEETLLIPDINTPDGWKLRKKIGEMARAAREFLRATALLDPEMEGRGYIHRSHGSLDLDVFYLQTGPDMLCVSDISRNMHELFYYSKEGNLAFMERSPLARMER